MALGNKITSEDYDSLQDGPVDSLVMPVSNAVTSQYKFSNISWLKGDLQQCVLRAATDWQRFQSAENAHALYMAVMAMHGIEPDNIHLLDGES